MNGVAWRVVASLMAVAVLAGCSSPDPAPPSPTGTSTTSSKAWPTPEDSGLRPVTVPYRDGLAYVMEETSAQALCHALSPAEWRELFGGDVGRTVEHLGGGVSCTAVSGPMTVHATMIHGSLLDTSAGDPHDIGGHQAWISTGESDSRAWAAAEVASRSAPDPAQSVLYLSASMEFRETRDGLDDLLRELLTILLTRLAHDGPATPVKDASGRVPFAATPPVPGVRLLDLPRPVQGLVLCTAMANIGAPHGIRTNMVAQCFADGDGRRALVVENTTDGGPAQFTVGGRPARFGPSGALLVDIAELPDTVTASSGVEYVQLMLDWRNADQTTMREWADRFVGQLGDL